MKTTLAERLVEAMNGPPKVTGIALAKHCKVAPPSVSAWRTGESKSLEGSNLLAAASFLGVNARWLADGIGPKYPNQQTGHAVNEPVAGYIKPKTYDAWTLEAIAILERHNRADRRAIVLNMRNFIKELGPPHQNQPHHHGNPGVGAVGLSRWLPVF